MSASDEEPERERIRHMTDTAAGITFLVIVDIVLLALGIYLAFQGTDVAYALSGLLLVLFLLGVIGIYKIATAEEKEEEQYANETPLETKTHKTRPV